MRLIDADRLMNRMRGNVLIDVTTELEKTIADQPTAFDKEKVIEELKQISKALLMVEKFNGAACIDKAIEIIEKGGIE